MVPASWWTGYDCSYMFSLSVSDFVSRHTSFIFILIVFNLLIEYSQLTQKVLNDLCLIHLQLILENTEFFFGDVPFTSHIVPQRACRKAAVVVRDWPTDILDWVSNKWASSNTQWAKTSRLKICILAICKQLQNQECWKWIWISNYGRLSWSNNRGRFCYS
jgi:hypothetical protein